MKKLSHFLSLPNLVEVGLNYYHKFVVFLKMKSIETKVCLFIT